MGQALSRHPFLGFCKAKTSPSLLSLFVGHTHTCILFFYSKILSLLFRFVESSSLDSSFSSQRPCLVGLLFLLCFASWRCSAAIPTLSYHRHSFWPTQGEGGDLLAGGKTSCRRRRKRGRRRRRPQHEVLDSSSSLRTLERTFPRRRKRKRKRKKRAVLPTRAFLCLFRKNWHFLTWNIFL